MKTVIGVYDSGIGGLTTLSKLAARLPQCDFRYLADNARMPFGTKSKEEIAAAVYSAIERLKQDCDIVVLGCNTASTAVNPDGVFKLKPRLDGCVPSETLVLATPLTLAATQAREKGFLTADTKELAVLTEIQASLCFKSKTAISMKNLNGYFAERLSSATESGKIKKVILGCSHYVYARDRLAALFPSAEFADGNDALTDEVCKCVHGFFEVSESASIFAPLRREYTGLGCCDGCGLARLRRDPSFSAPHPSVTFAFTAEYETDKYKWLLEKLFESYVAKDTTFPFCRCFQ